ncbi:MAG: N-acetylmuramoyl-L-alanine amidase family protein [Lachnospiraceae bacterium]|nr:N-acetylmuramoyl-L-alanine amidase family protein [Lachnospiraceae bacterium]
MKKTDLMMDKKIKNLAAKQKVNLPGEFEMRVDCLIDECQSDSKDQIVRFPARRVAAAGIILSVSVAGGVGAYLTVNHGHDNTDRIAEIRIEEYTAEIRNSELFSDLSRELTDQEWKRLNELAGKYKNEDIYPEQGLIQIADVSEIDPQRVCYHVGTGTLYFPEETLTDEDILELLDFYYNGSDSSPENSSETSDDISEESLQEDVAEPAAVTEGTASESQVSHMNSSGAGELPAAEPEEETDNENDNTDTIIEEQSSSEAPSWNHHTEEEWEQYKAQAFANDPSMSFMDFVLLRAWWDYEPTYGPEDYHYENEEGRLRLYKGNEPQGNTWDDVSYGGRYTDEEGYFYQNRWLYDQGKWFYFGEDYGAYWGWHNIDGNWYFFVLPMIIPEGRVCGEMVTGWLGFDYLHDPTVSWYYLDSDGRMVTGWQQIDGKWYYFNPDGKIRQSWQQEGDAWYYLSRDSNDCSMVKGWEKINGKWYYFADDGKLQTGWQKIDGNWYYFDRNGCMRQGWNQIRGKWYYFDENGAMLSNCSRTIDGAKYRFGASGEWIK